MLLDSLLSDADRRVAFFGELGFDIFGKSTFFVALLKWESLLKGMKVMEATAEAYEKALNDVITDATNINNFQQVSHVHCRFN